jgi:hypothetical protein
MPADWHSKAEYFKLPRHARAGQFLEHADRDATTQACLQGSVGVQPALLAWSSILLVIDHLPCAVGVAGDSVARIRAFDHGDDRCCIFQLAGLVDAHLPVDQWQCAL